MQTTNCLTLSVEFRNFFDDNRKVNYVEIINRENREVITDTPLGKGLLYVHLEELGWSKVSDQLKGSIQGSNAVQGRDLVYYELLRSIMSEREMDVAVLVGNECSVMRSLIETYRLIKELEGKELAAKIVAMYFIYCDSCTIETLMIECDQDIVNFIDDDREDFNAIRDAIKRVS